MQRERGVSIITAYKLVKGVLWLIFAVAIAVFGGAGLSGWLTAFAEHLRHHAGAWSLELAKLVTSAATTRGMLTIVVALVCDGVVTLVEGWALLRGRWWGPWLVVVATGSLLPFEVVALVRHLHPVRAVVLLLNVVIVVYLARNALRERRSRPRRERVASRPPLASSGPS